MNSLTVGSVKEIKNMNEIKAEINNLDNIDSLENIINNIIDIIRANIEDLELVKTNSRIAITNTKYIKIFPTKLIFDVINLVIITTIPTTLKTPYIFGWFNIH